MKNFIFSIFALTIFTFVACQKDVSIAETAVVKTDGVKNSDSTINANINTPESVDVIYVYKGVETPANDIDFTNNEELVNACGFIDGDKRDYIFDNDVELEDWANQLTNVTAKESLLNSISDSRALRTIAINTNALAEFESKGAAPAAFNIQVNNYWQNKYGTRPIPESLGSLYDQCGSGGFLWGLFFGIPTPYFPNNARKQASYIQGIGVTTDMLCTKGFFLGKRFFFTPIYHAFGKSFCGHWFNNSNVSCTSGF